MERLTGKASRLTILSALALLGVAGCGGGDDGDVDQPGGAADVSPAQIEKARKIGYSLCDPPISNRRQAEQDPSGYAEEEFGGPDEFDQARVEGCIDALTD